MAATRTLGNRDPSMRFKVCLALAAGCVGLLVLSIPAYSVPLPQPADRTARPLPKPKPQARLVAPRPAAAERAPAPLPAPMPVSLSARMSMPALVAEARKYMGTNPTARSKLWCATFMNMVLANLGYAGTNSDAAKSFAYYGRRISEPRIGAIAVLTRGKRGGHVGVVSGIDTSGNPIIISGNHNKRVGEAVYARSRVIAYVMPTERRLMPTQVADRSQPSSELGLESPITELLAAIDAEQARPVQPRPQQAAPQAQPVQVQRPAPPPVPHRVVQQTAEPVAPAPQNAARSGVSNPFSELMGRMERSPSPQPARAEPRARGRVAAADTGRGIR